MADAVSSSELTILRCGTHKFFFSGMIECHYKHWNMPKDNKIQQQK
jgi:hypothetical protein